MTMMNENKKSSFNFFVYQVLEYHTPPWDTWVKVGDLQAARGYHASLSIGPQQLPCLTGESFNWEIVMEIYWMEMKSIFKIIIAFA